LGPNTAQGAVWLSEKIEANAVSEPFLFAGWKNRMAWLHNAGNQDATFSFDIDKTGNGQWTPLRSTLVKAGQSATVVFIEKDMGEWIRVKSNRATTATVNFNYTDKTRYITTPDKMFNGLTPLSTRSPLDSISSYSGGLLYGLGDNRRTLGVLASQISNNTVTEMGYYELDSTMHLMKKDDPKTAQFMRDKFAIPKDIVSIDEASVLIVDDKNRRWRLPKGNETFTAKTQAATLRLCREVATERDLLNVHGTFYELPAENADGFAKIRPIASHNLVIHDYASYRGLLVMTGLDNQTVTNEHIITSDDGKAKIWAGAIDDLWKLGKPVGEGGVWKNSPVKANTPSDAYLIGFYDKKSLQLSHNSKQSVTFTLQIDPIGHAPWMTYKTLTVKPNQVFNFTFPDAFQARWIRFVADKDCVATAWLRYN
jgi:hypothetical protein